MTFGETAAGDFDAAAYLENLDEERLARLANEVVRPPATRLHVIGNTASARTIYTEVLPITPPAQFVPQVVKPKARIKADPEQAAI